MFLKLFIIGLVNGTTFVVYFVVVVLDVVDGVVIDDVVVVVVNLVVFALLDFADYIIFGCGQ